MALLTATELKSSREAAEAGVSTVSDADANAAIAEATAEIHALLGHKVEEAGTSFTFRGTGNRNFYLPQRARSVSSVTEDGNLANSEDYHLANSGWILKREVGTWSAEVIVVTGTFGFTSSDDEWILAKKAVRILAVRYLQATSTSNNLPVGTSGALLTGFSSEEASFQFFTPDSGQTGHADVDRLLADIAQISGYPFNSKKVLISVPLVGATGDERPYLYEES